MALLQILTTRKGPYHMQVIIPEYTIGTARKTGCRFKVLWLFHDLGQDATAWPRKTRLEQYADDYQIMVVCLSAENTFFLPPIPPENFDYQIVIQEYWYEIHAMFPCASDQKEDNYIAGCGMGGFAALRLAMIYSDYFSKVASFSGLVNAAHDYAYGDFSFQGIEQVFGSRDAVPLENDLYYVTYCFHQKGIVKPDLYISCGTDDLLYSQNKEYFNTVKILGFPAVWNEEAAGHDWQFFDSEMRKALKWMLK